MSNFLVVVVFGIFFYKCNTSIRTRKRLAQYGCLFRRRCHAKAISFVGVTLFHCLSRTYVSRGSLNTFVGRVWVSNVNADLTVNIPSYEPSQTHLSSGREILIVVRWDNNSDNNPSSKKYSTQSWSPQSLWLEIENNLQKLPKVDVHLPKHCARRTWKLHCQLSLWQPQRTTQDGDSNLLPVYISHWDLSSTQDSTIKILLFLKY